MQSLEMSRIKKTKKGRSPRNATVNASNTRIHGKQHLQKYPMIQASWQLHHYLHNQQVKVEWGEEGVQRNVAAATAAMTAAVVMTAVAMTAVAHAAAAATVVSRVAAAATSAAARVVAIVAIVARAVVTAAVRSLRMHPGSLN